MLCWRNLACKWQVSSTLTWGPWAEAQLQIFKWRKENSFPRRNTRCKLIEMLMRSPNFFRASACRMAIRALSPKFDRSGYQFSKVFRFSIFKGKIQKILYRNIYGWTCEKKNCTVWEPNSPIQLLGCMLFFHIFLSSVKKNIISGSPLEECLGPCVFCIVHCQHEITRGLVGL